MFKVKTWACLIFGVGLLIVVLYLIMPKSETPVMDDLVLENSSQASRIIAILADEAEKGRPVDQTILLLVDEKNRYRVPASLAADAVLYFYAFEIAELSDSCQQRKELWQNLVSGKRSYQEWLVADSKKERKLKLQALVASLQAIDKYYVSLQDHVGGVIFGG